MSVHEDTATLQFHIEDYEVKLMKSLYLQTQEGRLHDITLTAHGVSVRAHQAVLCAQSEYFEALLSGRWSEASTHDLSKLVWSAETVNSIVNFMYTGKVEITKDNIEELLNSASHLLMDDLRGACSKYLLANLAPKNCISIWRIGDQYQLPEVEAMCKAVAASCFQDYLLKREAMLELNQVFLEKIILTGLFDTVSSENLLRYLAAWQQEQKIQELPGAIFELLLKLPAFAGVQVKKVDDSNNTNIPRKTDEKARTSEVPMDISLEQQQDDSKTEAVFAYVTTKDPSRERWQPPLEFDLYMYLAKENSWKFIDQFENSTWDFLLQAELVGFVGDEAVYSGGMNYRSALVNYQMKTFKTLSFPDNSASSRKLFCFDGKLFLLESSPDTERNTSKQSLYIFDRTLMKWQKLSSVDFAELFPGFQNTSALFSYTILPMKDQVLIWVQDQTSQCTGPFWMCLQKDATENYTMLVLERQPLTKQDLRLPTAMSIRGWRHASFRLSADQEKVYVYRKQTVSDNTLVFDILLTYDIATNSWAREENAIIDIPRDINLPIHLNPDSGVSGKSFVQLDSNIQSLQHGSQYLIEKVCPFVTRMWTGHIGNKTWRQLTSPPVENIEGFKHFSIVFMPESLACGLGSSPEYKGISDDAPHSPLLHWDLCLTNKVSDIKLKSTVAQKFGSQVYTY